MATAKTINASSNTVDQTPQNIQGNSSLRNRSNSSVARRLELESRYGKSLVHSHRDHSRNSQRNTVHSGQ